MKKYDVKEGRHTPRIVLDPDEMMFEISGSSLPEDVERFYQPVIDWLDEFIHIITDTANPLVVSVRFNYYNSGSMRYIAEFFKRIKQINDKDVETVVKWFYDEEDDLLLEAGQDMEEVTGLHFEFIPE
jgi:hypothetical protein